jgi:hypothetical protein
MNQATGIIIERNARGVPSYARIDIKKYGDQLKDFFTLNGVEINDLPNEVTKKAMLEVKQNKTKGFNSIDELLYDLKH